MQLVCVTLPQRNYLRLSVQTNPDLVLHETLIRACEWIPSVRAKSFTVYDFRHTDYDGFEVDSPTGYASFSVKYFDTESEGMFKVADYIAETYIGKYNGGKPLHKGY